MNLSKIIRDLIHLSKEFENLLGNTTGIISYVSSYILKAVNEVWGFTYSTFSELVSGNPPSSLDSIPSRVDTLENDFTTHTGGVSPPYSHTADQIQVTFNSSTYDLQQVSDDYINPHLSTQINSAPYKHKTEEIVHNGVPLKSILDSFIGSFNLAEISNTYTPAYNGVLTYSVQSVQYDSISASWKFLVNLLHFSFDPDDISNNSITSNWYYWDGSNISSFTGSVPTITVTGSGSVETSDFNSRILPLISLQDTTNNYPVPSIVSLEKISNLNTFTPYNPSINIFVAEDGGSFAYIALVDNGSNTIDLEINGASIGTLCTYPASLPIYGAVPIYDNSTIGTPPIARGILLFIGMLDTSGNFRYTFITVPAYDGTNKVFDSTASTFNYSAIPIRTYKIFNLTVDQPVDQIYRLFGFKGTYNNGLLTYPVSLGLNIDHVGTPIISISQEASDLYIANVYLPVGLDGLIAYWYRISAALTLVPGSHVIDNYTTSVSKSGAAYLYSRVVGGTKSRIEVVDDVLESASSGIFTARILPTEAVVRYSYTF